MHNRTLLAPLNVLGPSRTVAPHTPLPPWLLSIWNSPPVGTTTVTKDEISSQWVRHTYDSGNQLLAVQKHSIDNTRIVRRQSTCFPSTSPHYSYRSFASPPFLTCKSSARCCSCDARAVACSALVLAS